ncbi:MAG TPA: hypothetical protein VFU59_07795, partial [Candidatus Eisenbacteria bacterium]|nr:hypothetical protein [Candidatus Eisenbacteria bacterium]
ILLLTLFYLHFSSVRRVGMSQLETAPAAKRSLRVAMYDLLLLVIFMVGGLMTLAVLFPQPFDAVADPFQTPPDARPPWYLLAPLALMELLSFLPKFLRGVIPEAILAVVVFLPFLDRESGSGATRKLFRTIGIALLVGWAALTFLGWYLEVRR